MQKWSIAAFYILYEVIHFSPVAQSYGPTDQM